MEKHIMRWSYWLGVVFVVLAIVARLLNIFGMPRYRSKAARGDPGRRSVFSCRSAPKALA
jgi:hypothetical protein